MNRKESAYATSSNYVTLLLVQIECSVTAPSYVGQQRCWKSFATDVGPGLEGDDIAHGLVDDAEGPGVELARPHLGFVFGMPATVPNTIPIARKRLGLIPHFLPCVWSD